MEFVHGVPASLWLKLAFPMLATCIFGALSQRRWRRAGPLLVAALAIVIAFGWSLRASKALGHPGQPAVHLVAAGLGSVAAGAVLVALGRLPMPLGPWPSRASTTSTASPCSTCRAGSRARC